MTLTVNLNRYLMRNHVAFCEKMTREVLRGFCVNAQKKAIHKVPVDSLLETVPSHSSFISLRSNGGVGGHMES